MGLTGNQQQMVLNHIRSKVAGGCPMCGNRNWNIEPDLQYLGILDPEYKQPIEGSVYPVVTAMCTNCHFVAQFSAMRVGVLS